MKHVVFSDFDGTITAKDTIDAMYDAFGPEDWPGITRELYSQGLRSRRIIRKMLGMFDVTREEIVELLRTLLIRDGFVEFREFCRRDGYELVIVSEGIGLSVETVLHERGIDDLPYFGNVLVRGRDGRWTTLNPHRHPDCADCGNCKGQHLIERKKRGDAVVYVGDGATDRCAAQLADVVFATGYLARFCEKTGIPFVRFETFQEIVREMSKEEFKARLEAEARRDIRRKTKLPRADARAVAEDGNPDDQRR